MVETITQLTPKAKKQHKCNFCHGIIERGEIYTHQTNKLDGELYTWKSHLSCDRITVELKMDEYADEGVTDEWFMETIKEEYRDIMIKTKQKLYESKDFRIPSWLEQLKFVKEYHLDEIKETL